MQKSIKQLGNVFAGANRDNPNPGRVYDEKGLCPTLGTMQGGNREPMIVESIAYDEQNEQIREETVGTLTTDGSSPKHNNRIIECVAMRGRNPENPSDRTAGSYLEQRLEVNESGIANTLTTVQKDNMVLIRQATKEGAIPCKVGGGWRI